MKEKNSFRIGNRINKPAASMIQKKNHNPRLQGGRVFDWARQLLSIFCCISASEYSDWFIP